MLNQNIKIGFLIIILCLAAGNYSYCQSRFFVKVGATGNGQSWEDALGSLETVFELAQSGDSIFVAKGTYIPSKQWDVYEGVQVSGSPRQATFKIPNGIVLLGGFSGDEEQIGAETIASRNFYENETILSGDLSSNDKIEGTFPDVVLENYEENAYHVLFTENLINTTIDGFTVGGGNANGGSVWASENSQGAGLFNRAYLENATDWIISSLFLRNMVFQHNVAEYDGAGISNLAEMGGSISFSCFECFFFQNEAIERGGGIANSVLLGSIKSAFINNKFTENKAQVGGAIFSSHAVNNPVKFDLVNSVVINNEADRGGGIFFGSFESAASDSLTIINSTLTGNKAYSNGGGIYLSSNNSPSYIQLYNSIFWDNQGEGNSLFISYDKGPLGDFMLTASNNLIEEPSIDDLNMNSDLIDIQEEMFYGIDPLFVDAQNQDISLSEKSVAIDAGQNFFLPDSIQVDINQNQRIVNGQIDLGGSEFSLVTGYEPDVFEGVLIYPNPASDFIKIEGLEGNKSFSYEILSSAGDKVLSGFIPKSNSIINVSSLPKGLYILQIRVSNQQVIAVKVIIV